MGNTQKLIEACVRNDPESWVKMWQMVESAGVYPVQRLLQNQGLGLELADDIAQEFYLWLRSNNFKYLREFQGQSFSQLRVYLRSGMVHFALNFRRKMTRMRRVEAEAQRMAPRPEREPTEEQTRFAVREIESLMSDKDRARFAQLMETDSTAMDVGGRSARTNRRWREELLRKYGHKAI